MWSNTPLRTAARLEAKMQLQHLQESYSTLNMPRDANGCHICNSIWIILLRNTRREVLTKNEMRMNLQWMIWPHGWVHAANVGAWEISKKQDLCYINMFIILWIRFRVRTHCEHMCAKGSDQIMLPNSLIKNGSHGFLTYRTMTELPLLRTAKRLCCVLKSPSHGAVITT